MQTEQSAVGAPVEARVSPLSIQDCENLFWLAARNVIFFSTYNEKIEDWDQGWHVAVNCNDTFYWASADAHSLDGPAEVRQVREAFERFGWAGPVAFVAHKRGHDPLPHLCTERYREAWNELLPNCKLSITSAA